MKNNARNQKNGWRRRLAKSAVLRGERKKYLQEIRELESASAEEIAQYRQMQLKRVLQDARENVPYYRDRATGNTLESFPILTRTDIKNHREELIVSSRINKKTKKDTTSGTTSEPISFLLDQGHRDRGAVQKVFFNEWAGLRLGDPMAKFWGIFPAKTWKGKLRIRVSNGIRNVTEISTLDLRAFQMKRIAKEIQSLQPKLILAYANSMYEYSLFLERNHIPIQYDGAIMTSTSSLTPIKYEAIHKAFQCPIFDRYGSREMIDFACDCDRHEGLHVSPYMHAVEILDEAGNPCPPGVMGRVVVTQLFNSVMPLIRYDLGDYGTWAEKPCSCGRNWPMIKQVDGRAICIFRHRDGGRFSSYYCMYHVNRVIGQHRIKRQQIIQEDYNRFLIKLIMVDPNHWEDREANRLRLEELIGELINEPAEVHFEVVADIPLQPSGKYLQAICKEF